MIRSGPASRWVDADCADAISGQSPRSRGPRRRAVAQRGLGHRASPGHRPATSPVAARRTRSSQRVGHDPHDDARARSSGEWHASPAAA